MKHKIESAVKQLSLVAQSVLQQLKMRNPVFVQCDEFAVNNGVAFDAFERLRDLDIAVANDLAVAAVKGDLATFNLRHHAKPVIFVLEDPPGIVERAIGQRGKHWLKALR